MNAEKVWEKGSDAKHTRRLPYYGNMVEKKNTNTILHLLHNTSLY